MTVGENIRRLRKERGLTLQQLGDMIGVKESYIRAYETGKRNPKLQSLEALAKALSVNVEVLTNSEFDGVKAMHRLFQVFRQYSGTMVEYQDKDGKDIIGISFESLPLMRSWYNRYQAYMEETEKCNEIKDVKQRAEALLKAESDFNRWMDMYPDTEPDQALLEIQKKHDAVLDQMGLHLKND